MNNRVSHKVAMDLYLVQMTWTLVFLGIMFIVHIVKVISAFFIEGVREDFFLSVHASTFVYMLVIGLIGAQGFFPYFVGNGITRRNYFKGTFFGLVGLAVTIAVIVALITGLEYMIVKLFNLPIVFTNTMNNVFESSTPDLGEIIKMVVMSPYFDLSSSWTLSMFTFVLFACIHYLIGWLIGAGFYSLGKGVGFGLIVLAIGFVLLRNILWGMDWGKPFYHLFPLESFEFPLIVSVCGTIVIIGILLWMIWRITKRAVIKL